MQEENVSRVVNNATDTRSEYAILAPPLFSVIIVVGCIGNTLLLYTVIRWREMRTPCNYLIANNAIADLGIVTIAAPLRIVDVYQGWVLGKPVCQLLAPTQDALAVVSIITYTLIAFERYRAVLSPFKRKLSSRSILIIILVTWVLAYLSAGLPIAMHLTVVNKAGKSYCMASFASDVSRQIYEIYLVVVFLLIPLTLQTLAYSRLVHRLTREDPLKRSFSDPRSSHKRQLKKKRLVRVTITLVVFFHICYIPRMVVMLIYEFARPSFTNNIYFKYADLVILVLFYVKHVINPLILFSISTAFRRRFPCNMSNMYNCRSSFLARALSSRRLTLTSKLIETMEKGNGENGEVIHRESML
ncbi:neuropeptide FF receptor 1-like [Montipora foliosa]|uniref:neuropeptide FF receptor 1-like n=1 Tax=Montipora foliosa TaxID=591990 RepID=UPI0035F21B0C